MRRNKMRREGERERSIFCDLFTNPVEPYTVPKDFMLCTSQLFMHVRSYHSRCAFMHLLLNYLRAVSGAVFDSIVGIFSVADKSRE
jgi:hypothetical protein